jgi:transglutaminase-like putative cysteine protease
MRRKFVGLSCAVCCTALAMATQATAADAPAWMHAAANAPLPAYDSKTNAVLLYSEDVTTVTPDGKMKGIERRVYKILRPEGREYAAVHAYVRQDTHVGSMRGWCIPKSGKDYEVKDKDAIEKTVEGYGELVTDLRVRILPIPAAEPGNIVGYEIQYNDRPYVLDDQWEFQASIPVKEARYTLQMPPGWEYKAVWVNHGKVEPSATGGNQWQWVVTDLPAIRPETAMPPFEGVAGRMIVSFFAPGAPQRNGFLTWDDMGKWAAGLASGRRDATPEINKKVAELAIGRNTLEQKMEGVAGFLQKDIRYVAIELGVGGWQPHAAADVFTHRYGDCKDKATLMSAMLKQFGVDSYYLFINTERGAVGPDTPPERVFDHAILAIKLPDQVQSQRYQAVLNHPKLGRLLIFDPTNEKNPIGQLSGELQGNYALLVTPEGGELVETPQLPTRSNGVVRTGTLKLEAHGALSGEVQETRFGDFAVYERYAQLGVKSSKDRVKRIEQEVSRSIGMFDITHATMQNLDNTDAPFGYTYTFVAPAYAKQIGDLIMVRPRVMGSRSSDILETKEPRQFPVIFNGPERDTDTFEITLPTGYQADDLPPPVDVDYGFASYHSKTESAGNTLKYTRIFEIKELSVPLSKVEDLRKLYRMIASDERNTAVLKPVAH